MIVHGGCAGARDGRVGSIVAVRFLGRSTHSLGGGGGILDGKVGTIHISAETKVLGMLLLLLIDQKVSDVIFEYIE